MLKDNDHKVRVAGFEPATTCSQNRYATMLRYTLGRYPKWCPMGDDPCVPTQRLPDVIPQYVSRILWGRIEVLPVFMCLCMDLCPLSCKHLLHGSGFRREQTRVCTPFMM